LILRRWSGMTCSTGTENTDDAVAAWKSKPELNATTVRVNGYTDSKGSAAYNKNLSKRRADAVLAALKQRLAALKGSVRANGERHPVATNKTAKGRALNRRVTITVTG